MFRSRFAVYAVEIDDENDVEPLLYQAFADNWTNNTSEFFKVDAQPLIAAMKLAFGKNVTPKGDIA